MDFIGTIKKSQKFESFTNGSNDIGDEMFGFKLKGKHVFHWFTIINGKWFYDHSYSMNTGRTTRRISKMPAVLSEIYIQYLKSKTATDGNNTMKNNIISAIADAKNNGGVTFHMDKGILADIPYYCISTYGNEVRVPELTEEVVREFIMHHSAALTEDNVCLGIWKDGNEFCLDITDLWSKDEYTLDGVREIGRLRSQLAIYDLEKKEEIRCFDFEVYCKDGSSIIQANNRPAIDFFSSLGYTEDHSGRFPFLGERTHKEMKNNPKNVDALEIMESGFSLLVR